MTCYWDSILSCLTREDHVLIGFNHIPRLEQFIEKLKEKNKLITALWQGKLLSKREQEEHQEEQEEQEERVEGEEQAERKEQEEKEQRQGQEQ